METRPDRESGTTHAPLIYDKERGFCDIGQSLKSEYPDVSLIKKICYGGHGAEDSGDVDRAVKIDCVLPPAILAVQVMRFRTADGLDSEILPEGRDMAAPQFLSACSSSYVLQSVVEQVGDSAKSGQYVAYGRDVTSGLWIRYDDATVTLSSESEATRVPYIALYQRSHTTLLKRRRILSCS